jgi:hypothetical protein
MCSVLLTTTYWHNTKEKAQFSTFDESSYEGKPLLFGPTLQNSSTKTENSVYIGNGYEGEEGDGLMDMDVFYISFVVAYIKVLMGI